MNPEEIRIDVVERGQPATGIESQMPRNISPTGILFESPHAYEIGRRVSVICNNLKKIDQVTLPARVMRVEELEDPQGEMCYEVGLAFELQWEHQVREIMEFLERYRSPELG